MYFNKQKHNNSAEKTLRITKILQNDTKTVKNELYSTTYMAGKQLMYEKMQKITVPLYLPQRFSI